MSVCVYVCVRASAVFTSLNTTWLTGFFLTLAPESSTITSNKDDMIITTQFYVLVITLKGLNDIGAVSQRAKQPVNAFEMSTIKY